MLGIKTACDNLYSFEIYMSIILCQTVGSDSCVLKHRYIHKNKIKNESIAATGIVFWCIHTVDMTAA